MQLTQTDTIQFANLMSNLPYEQAYKMFKDCIKDYGFNGTRAIVRLAEIYLDTKQGRMERAEAVRKQIEILEEANI